MNVPKNQVMLYNRRKGLKDWIQKNSFGLALLLLPLASFCQEVKFNNVNTVACHNCYEKKLAVDFQDVFSYTSTIELDIWNESFGLGMVARLLGKSMHNDWYVKHKPHQRGNKNVANGSLRDCLLQIKAWSDANPQHPVITIFIDKKQNWVSARRGKSPADLDKLLLSVFTKDDIFLPADLLQDKENLKAAAWENWPSLESLKGKFVFVLTDGTILNKRRPLNEYQEIQKKNAVCFISPRVSSEKEVYRPKGLSESVAQNVVFYNLKENHSKLAEAISQIECISRVYGSSKNESLDRYEKLSSRKVNFVAFYNYKLAGERGERML